MRYVTAGGSNLFSANNAPLAVLSRTVSEALINAGFGESRAAINLRVRLGPTGRRRRW